MKAIVLSPLNKCVEVVYIDPEVANSKEKIEQEIEYCAGCNIADVSYMLCEDNEDVPVFINGSDETTLTL